MKYLPIFQELFESDSIIFMLIGLILAVFIGIKMNNNKKIIICLVSSFALYAVCELASNIHTNFMIELILLFAGTIAIGGIIGFLTSALTHSFSAKWRRMNFQPARRRREAMRWHR